MNKEFADKWMEQHRGNPDPERQKFHLISYEYMPWSNCSKT